MLFIALRMLFGDKVKLMGLIAGIGFSTLLMAQQGGFFVGLVSRSANGITSVSGAKIWVMDPRTETAETPVTLRPIDLYRVRSVEGVKSATPLLQATVTLRTSTGRSAAVTIYGVDDDKMVGLPRNFVAGNRDALRSPDAFAIDLLSFNRLWPEITNVLPNLPPLTIEINDHRAVVAAVTDTLPGFASPGAVHARAANAKLWAPDARPSYILVTSQGDVKEVAARISMQTGLKALSSEDFSASTVTYVLANTGIAFSFGVVIALGAVVGILVSGLTFSLFVNDNIRQFAVLKAVGVSNSRLIGMVAAQAITVATLGYSFGLWAVSSFFDGVNQPLSDLKGFFLPWQIAVAVAVATILIVMLATIFSLRRVLRLDPATIFRG